MAQDLFTNITILISFLSIAGQVFKNYSLEKDAPLKIRIMIGGIFALMGITLMFFTIKATDIVIFDLRNLAIICAGIFGGPIAVIISALGIGIFRVAYFGINIASIVAFSVAIITGLGLVYISKSSYKRLNKFILMFLLSMIFSTMALIYLLMDAPHLMEILRYYWLIYVLGGIIAYYTCEYIMLNNKTFKEMSYYQIMADNLLDMITIYTAEGMYSYASPSSKQLLGKDPKEIIGKDALHLIHPDDLAKITEIQAGFKMDEFREYTQELRLRDQDGQYIWTESTFKSIKDIDGNLKEIICATRDISERKAIEKRLREQREEAIEANRLKSQFLANMSHELRTPLNSIIGFTTRVIKKSKDDLSPIQLENLEIVKEEGQHLLALINDLLDYSKIEAGKMDVNIEAFNLDTVIDEALSMTKGLMDEKEIQFEKVIKSNSELQIVSDRIKMKQILVNLLSNAFKYSDQGKVTLSIGKIDKCYNISVCDEGIGIEKGQLENIFDEFHQIDGSYTRKVGGTGLGLAITKRFVEMMGGRIHVESTIDVGSCFTIMMPMDYNEKCLAEDHIDIGGLQEESNNTVVFIEDDTSTRKLYSQYLSEEGFIPISIDEEKNIIEEVIKINPIVIILDIILKNRDGWDILNKLKEHPMTKDIPVIMASALNEQKIAYQLHADEYLVKPILQEELIEAINRMVGNSQQIKVLVADDDSNYLNLISQYLKEADISFITAKDGKETIKMLNENNPELVLLDLMMPELTGFEVLDWIRKSEKHRHTQVIIVSSKDLTSAEKEDLLHSTYMIIQKSGLQIEDVIRSILEEKGWERND
jgi:PAS domain S-box-containing protein